MTAIVTSHNIIIVHNEMIRFPDIAFFVSPIPLHIAAMVILYGHMSSCKMLTRQQALEDVWMALDMLPRFRWRWERKDLNGGHPLIAKLAEKVFDAPLHQAGPTSRPMLMPELEWTLSLDGSTTPGSPMVATPSTAAASTTSFVPTAGFSGTRPQVKLQEGLAEVPPQWFYPLPHEPLPMDGAPPPRGGSGTSGGYAPLGTIGCAPSQESYMQEEKDSPLPANPQMDMWVTMVSGGTIDVWRPDSTTADLFLPLIPYSRSINRASDPSCTTRGVRPSCHNYRIYPVRVLPFYALHCLPFSSSSCWPLRLDRRNVYYRRNVTSSHTSYMT